MDRISGIALPISYALTVFLLFTGVSATAHSSGASLERAAGEYFIDIGYEPVDITEGDRLILDFNINKGDKAGERIEFDSVWVRIKGEETLLSAGIGRADIGATTLLYVVPGDVEELSIGVRFEKDGEVLTDAEFTLPVLQRELPFMPYVLPASAVLGALIFLALLTPIFRYYLLKRKAQ